MATQRGRPSDLSYSVPNWDSSGNYPAGSNPWNGTPKLVQPPTTYFEPGIGAAAEHMNWVTGNAFSVDGSAKTNIQALLDLLGHTPALNWHGKGTSTHNLRRAVYSPKDAGIWVAVGPGGNDFADISTDYGKTWTSLTGSLGAAIAIDDCACSTAGTFALVCEATRTVYKGARTAFNTFTWTSTVNALTIAPTAFSCVVDYEPNAALFVSLYRNGASGQRCDTSATVNAAWTNRTASLPAVWTAYTGTNSPELTCTGLAQGANPGISVGIFVDAGATPKYNTARSTDGGATWTGVQLTPNIAQADLATNSTCSKPAFDEVNGLWYIAVSSSSNRQTEVWKSTDNGLTYALTKFFTTGMDVVLHDIAAIGALLVGINDDGRIIYSTDQGVTWKWGTGNGTSSASRCFLRVGAGGFLHVDQTNKWLIPSHRFDNAQLVVA